MIFDSIKNAKMYYGLGAGMEKALKFFESYDMATFETGRQEVDGEKLFVNRLSYTTAENPDALFEAHREYADVMYVLEGEERFFVKPLADMQVTTQEYDPAIEACLGKIDGDAAQFRFPKGYFCVFFPQDAHCASQLWDKPCAVKKLIAKVRMDTL